MAYSLIDAIPQDLELKRKIPETVFGNVTINWSFRGDGSSMNPFKSPSGIWIERSGCRQDPNVWIPQELRDLESTRVCPEGPLHSQWHCPVIETVAAGKTTLDRDVASAEATCFPQRQITTLPFAMRPTC